jgi:nucleotidyltransferase/DNA polymerase involved in DNA repair
MMRKYHVRFGGGRMEKGSRDHLASRLPYSYEMKAAGVKTGVPIWEALQLCPDGLYVKRDFRWYEVLSRRCSR